MEAIVGAHKLIHLHFHYDPSRARNDARRTANELAHPLFNPNPVLFQEDEVAYASTWEGGARGVRNLVRAIENQQHGNLLAALIKTYKLTDGDIFDVVLIPRDYDQYDPTPGVPPLIPPKKKYPSYEKLIEKYRKVPFPSPTLKELEKQIRNLPSKPKVDGGHPFSAFEKLLKDLLGIDSRTTVPVPAPAPVLTPIVL
ncbi:hypothetical protein CLV59_109244 [Chitinophaga dinghuensis]|uniref:Deoxyribonuclease NucA/NucB domain-containing protein n=1 Tax=Chitinophaga dinghuensis TaxID=1539050 RepID=A0A327VLJ7_9BACT|nr:hypothetical protein [Chitinophaga dinghuensis]RAJ75630.1 hypothetical protein CLV59_109244 [Chitinophaga dinghuensis]